MFCDKIYCNFLWFNSNIDIVFENERNFSLKQGDNSSYCIIRRFF